MNVALPALIVFLLLLPGFIVRSRFKRAERASLDYSPFGQVATEAMMWACVLHILWLAVSYLWFGVQLDITVLLKLLSSDSPSQSKAAETVAVQFFRVVLYFGTLLAAAYLVPPIVRDAITRWRLDRFDAPFSSLLRFHQAPWYYLLTGADFKKENQPDFISISAIVNVAGDAVLYTGVLDEFFFNSDGALDRLVLQQVMRRPMDADKLETSDADDLDRFYVVDGDYFVLRYSEAITLNVEYIKLDTDMEDSPGDANEAKALSSTHPGQSAA